MYLFVVYVCVWVCGGACVHTRMCLCEVHVCLCVCMCEGVCVHVHVACAYACVCELWVCWGAWCVCVFG